MNTSSVNFLGRVFFVKKHIWPTVDEETKKFWGAESEKKIAALKEQDGAGSSSAVGAGEDEQEDDPMLGLEGNVGAVDEDGMNNLNAGEEEDDAENEDDDENDDDENENDEDDDVSNASMSGSGNL